MKKEISKWKGKKVLLVGLGLHGGGEATARWLSKQGAILRVTDSKTAEQLQPTLQKLKKLRNITYHLGSHRPEDFSWAEVVVLNPGVAPSSPVLAIARKRKIPIVNEATIFFEASPAPIVGVTGTRGKTTTTTLIGDILRQAKHEVIVSGNVRQIAMLDHLDKITSRDSIVLELSSYQLELIPAVKRSPMIAVLTNIKVDHLSRHGTLLKYADIKFNLLRYQTKRDVAVLNADNAWSKKAAKITQAEIVWFSRRGPVGNRSVYIKKGWVTERSGRRDERLFPVSIYPHRGDHQQENLLAAVAAARAACIDTKPIIKAVKAFPGVPHRQEKVRSWRGHDFINDTTATSPDGALAAIQVFPKSVFILGGTDKQLDFKPLARAMVKHKLPTIFLPGNATDKILKLLRKYGYRAPHMFATSMEQAVHQAVELAKPSQAIVLSPGCASFGLFVHEFDRGEKFVKAVQKLR